MSCICRAVWLAGLLMLVPASVSGQDGLPDNSRIDLDITDDPSEFYWGTIEEREQQDEDAARESGDMSLPRFLGPNEERQEEAPVDEDAVVVEEPAAEPERRGLEGSGLGARVDVAVPRGEGREDGLGLAIGLLFEQWNRTPNVVRIVYGAGVQDEGVGQAVVEDVANEVEGSRSRRVALPRVASGEGLYGRVLYGVSSDYPGPVLLELLQAPLAGAVLRGGFEVVRERLVLRFSSMEYRGERVAVEALAVDPDCACYGVEGEVDRHFFERVLLPAALAFGQGYLDALASPLSTITTVDGDLVVEERANREDAELYAGAAGAARALGGVILETAPRGPTVTLERDTELVVVFMSGLEVGEGRSGDG